MKLNKKFMASAAGYALAASAAVMNTGCATTAPQSSSPYGAGSGYKTVHTAPVQIYNDEKGVRRYAQDHTAVDVGYNACHYFQRAMADNANASRLGNPAAGGILGGIIGAAAGGNREKILGGVVLGAGTAYVYGRSTVAYNRQHIATYDSDCRTQKAHAEETGRQVQDYSTTPRNTLPNFGGGMRRYP